jgi:hypothetical protein
MKNKLSISDVMGKRVMIYYNLHKHTFSIKYKNKVLTYSDHIKLSNVEFKVNQKGKERVRTEKVKNVHAFVIGDLEYLSNTPCENLQYPVNNLIVTYNPYINDNFVIKNTNEPIKNAKKIELVNLKDKIFITHQ